MKTILCLCQELGALSLMHRQIGFNLFIFQVLDVLKTHSDKARLELSPEGKSRKLKTFWSCIQLLTTRRPTTRKKLMKILFSILKISLSLYTILKTLLSYNQFHNILRLFDVLPNFPFTTSETMGDWYL